MKIKHKRRGGKIACEFENNKGTVCICNNISKECCVSALWLIGAVLGLV